tara:strand:- start:1823 stop:2149 length:327 start_codon:yes stop_codon:yes gene_type:complete
MMADESTLKSLDYLRRHYVDSLRISMSQLKDVAENCLKKIEAEGTSGYYSGNSDIHRYAANAWRASWALCELKMLEDKIAGEVDKIVEQKLTDLLESIKKPKEEKLEK